MKNPFKNINLDFLGFSASMLCAIHCLAMPVVLSISALSGLHFLENELIEMGMISLAAFIAFKSLLNSYYNKHHKPHAMPLAVVGFLLLFGSLVAGHEADWGSAVMAFAGGLMVALAHLVNWKLVKKYASCKFTDKTGVGA